MLYQSQGGTDRVISYASRTLSEAEKNYHLHSGKLEFLALKWSIIERFSDYVKYGEHVFDVYTDNNPLTYVLTTAKLNATGMRWVAELADYNFRIHYKPGPTNVDCDYLSRRPTSIAEYKDLCTESVDLKAMSAVVSGVSKPGEVLAGAISVDNLVFEGEGGQMSVSLSMLIKADQRADSIIAPVYEAVLTKTRPSRRDMSKWDRRSCILLRSFGKLKLEKGILMRGTAKKNQIVMPQKYHQLVIDEIHTKMGHLGPEKSLDLAQQRFYWAKMADDIKQFINKKCRCLIDKHPNVKECAELHPVEAQYPFEMVSIDFVLLEKCKGGYTYVLTVIDHFTRFVQFYGTRSKSSKAAAEVLFNQFIVQFGFPVRISHDKGPEFNSRLFAELHRLTGIKSSNTTPYNPQGNGSCERYNRVLISMLRALSAKEKSNWKSHLPKLAFAVNATRNKSTGFSSFFLLFGWEARLPIDHIFQEVWGTKSETVTHEQFAENWQKSMQQAYDIARINIGKAAGYNKRWYDRKAKTVEIKVNDLVLVKNDRERLGKKKLRSYWENSIFRVVEVKKDLPVYKVKNIHKDKDIRLLHRNKLMLVNEIPLDLFEDQMKEPSTSKPKKPRKNSKISPVPAEDDSDEGDIIIVRELVEELSGNETENEIQVEAPVEEGENPENESHVRNLMSEIESEPGDPISEIEDALEESEEEVANSSVEESNLPDEEVDQSESDGDDGNVSDTSSEDTPPRRTSARGRIPKMITNMQSLGGNLVLEPIAEIRR